VHRHPLESNETTCVCSPCDSKWSTRYNRNMVVTSPLDEGSSGVHMRIKRVQRAPSPCETLTFSLDAGADSPRDDTIDRIGHASRAALRAAHAALTNDGVAAP